MLQNKSPFHLCVVYMMIWCKTLKFHQFHSINWMRINFPCYKIALKLKLKSFLPFFYYRCERKKTLDLSTFIMKIFPHKNDAQSQYIWLFAFCAATSTLYWNLNLVNIQQNITAVWAVCCYQFHFFFNIPFLSKYVRMFWFERMRFGLLHKGVVSTK